MSQLLQCYNTNCGQKFDPEKNHSEACVFHSGEPFFHDAYKGWNCCNRKATDFTEFLNFKGCAKGPHNPTKPPEPEKKPKENDQVKAPEAPKPPKPATAAPRELGASELVEVRKVVSAAAKSNWEKVKTAREEEKSHEIIEEAGEVKILPGTPCQHNACTSVYHGPESDLDPCFYHPGTPVFHEGMKYWSCCQKKTSDFDNFMSQMGCVKDAHVWKKDKVEENTKLECRRDFHQTASDVILTIYAKNADPFGSIALANAITLSISITDVDGKSLELRIPLWGEISPADSVVNVTPSKVEVKLKKAEAFAWPRYEHQ